ncbi:NADH-quinone oxidoreductase subunit N [Reticulibacter mediterranei]|uniref:NADH-quinone oxidoreductase subunit N n=1 Tax=Reticulibacter mediterranei TaxID=2778369 RepID=A0A8J3IV01_9CHLR|nr:NADH-quinone oxidoreductase subunit N [Reticulibacter mediterranei]GHP01164.1 NADH-quinone oxidoreductase subunit N [Reticulibacter mediterranei]
MGGMQGGMELWAIVPEMTLGVLVLLLLPLGPFLPPARKYLTTTFALIGLGVVAVESSFMLSFRMQPIFLGTYAVDPFAVYFKLFAVVTTAFVLLATESHFRGRPHEGEVPALLLLTCLGIMCLTASQNLALIALFIQLVTVGSYILIGIAKESRLATEAALKMFLFSAAVGAVMVYGMALLFGLTGTLDLLQLARTLPSMPVVTVIAAFCLVLVGYGFEVTLVPFHTWAPDAYQGASTPIAGFLSVGPKAAGVAVLLRTLFVAFPHGLGYWPELFAVLAAVTMTVGNIFALRQTSVKRLLAYSSIGQVGYVLVGVAAAQNSPFAIPGMLIYLAVYLFMNLGAFLAVDAMERQVQSDSLVKFAGLGRRLPFSATVLAVCILALAGFPPFGSFVGKVMLFSATLDMGWTWLAVVMLLNIGLSLYYYIRVLVPLYLRSSKEQGLQREPFLLRVALFLLASGVLLSGLFPQLWVAFATHTSLLLR